MNTTEVVIEKPIESFSELFDLARKQFLEYEKIEGIADWDSYDFSIDCGEDQLKFKDMMQIRFIEELTEATADMENEDHFWEEISDALNFFLSGYIMLGKDLNKLPNPEIYLWPRADCKGELPNSASQACLDFYPVVHSVGYLCNLLKNRPWSQSNYLVDLLQFEERLETLWKVFWKFLGQKLFLGRDKIFDMFLRKVKVNQYRIETGY